MLVSQRSKGGPLLHQMISSELDYKSTVSANKKKSLRIFPLILKCRINVMGFKGCLNILFIEGTVKKISVIIMDLQQLLKNRTVIIDLEYEYQTCGKS